MERKCLADERKDLHPFHYGRDSGHDLGRCDLGSYDYAGGAAQRRQHNPPALLLGEFCCNIDAF